jgi:hypothetical protein
MNMGGRSTQLAAILRRRLQTGNPRERLSLLLPRRRKISGPHANRLVGHHLDPATAFSLIKSQLAHPFAIDKRSLALFILVEGYSTLLVSCLPRQLSNLHSLSLPLLRHNHLTANLIPLYRFREIACTNDNLTAWCAQD